MFEALRRFFTGKTAEQLQAEKEERERVEWQAKLTQGLLPHYIALRRNAEESQREYERLRKEAEQEEANGKPAPEA